MELLCRAHYVNLRALKSVLALIVLLSVGQVVMAQTPDEIDVYLEPAYAGIIADVDYGDTIDVDVNIINSYEHEIGGATFTIQYDTLGLDFVEGIPHLGQCEWFTNSATEVIPGQINFTAVTLNFGCSFDVVGNPAVTLRFAVRDLQALTGYKLPIEFVWADCYRNQLSDDSGLLAMLSNDVYRWFDDYNSVTHDSEFPTIFGLPSTCYAPADYDVVNYHSGYVEVGEAGLYPQGDANLNGIPYEIADALTISNYLHYGFDAFTTDPAMQLHGADADADLRAGMVSDYVYTLQVLRAQAVPSIGWRGFSAPGTAFVTHHLDTKSIEIDWADSISALLLRFSGDIEVTSSNIPLSVETVANAGNTRVLVLPDLAAPDIQQFSGDVQISYSGDGRLTEVQLADLRNRRIPVMISRIPGNLDVCGDANGDGIVSLRDAILLVNYIFGGESLPVETTIADANCDGAVTIADVVGLIKYIFASGPGPCSLCQ